jgi:hypothetical protein
LVQELEGEWGSAKKMAYSPRLGCFMGGGEEEWSRREGKGTLDGRRGNKTHLHQSPLDLSIRTCSLTKPPTSNRIDLIHENDTRLMFLGIGKHFSNQSGGFTNVLVDDLDVSKSSLQRLELEADSIGRPAIYTRPEEGGSKLTAEETTLRKLVLSVAATALARRVLPIHQLCPLKYEAGVGLPVPGGP